MSETALMFGLRRDFFPGHAVFIIIKENIHIDETKSNMSLAAADMPLEPHQKKKEEENKSVESSPNSPRVFCRRPLKSLSI